MPIIEVKHLTKEYDLGAVTSIKDSLRHTLAKIQGKDTWQRERFKALDDVNFTIEEGEVVGIIGHNGAGKSTLLKHLANITKPTSGDVIVNGSIAPLIEVGAGVNPELTGRENIFLNGAILGIPKRVIQSKLDEIIDFSELEQFIDTPVKRYSSGMTVKLGFSIATSMDADILIIDEVLAVGDLAFQRKCFDRMETLINKEGKTVLLVSHNIRQVSRMCSRVILLNHGSIIIDGDPEEACTAFYDENNKQIQSKLVSSQQESNNKVELIDIQTINPAGLNIENIKINEPLNIRIKIKVHQEIIKPEIVVGTHTTDFIYLTASSTDTHEKIDRFLPGEYEITFTHRNYPLKPGAYGVRMNVFDQNRNTLFHGENLSFFTVDIDQSESNKPPLRLIDIEGEFQINRIDKTKKNNIFL